MWAVSSTIGGVDVYLVHIRVCCNFLSGDSSKLASFPGPSKRGEGLVHTACSCVGAPEKCGVLDTNVYVTVYSPMMHCHGDLAHARAVCTRPSLLYRRAWEHG